jgi:ribosomal protein S8
MLTTFVLLSGYYWLCWQSSAKRVRILLKQVDSANKEISQLKAVAKQDNAIYLKKLFKLKEALGEEV